VVVIAATPLTVAVVVVVVVVIVSSTVLFIICSGHYSRLLGSRAISCFMGTRYYQLVEVGRVQHVAVPHIHTHTYNQ